MIRNKNITKQVRKKMSEYIYKRIEEQSVLQKKIFLEFKFRHNSILQN